MSKNLVIVESPSKAVTLRHILGDQYEVESSIGHIRDMPRKGLGIDLENNFTPTYEVSADKKSVINKLKKKSKEVDKIYLATDEDREGEAIAWHLLEVLELPADTPRIVFHEITNSAIKKALEEPRKIDLDLVNAQQARRIIDRLVGFEISPLLWRKVAGARSAGRVQSPVVRLVVEREREIIAHEHSNSFVAKGEVTTDNGESFPVKLPQALATKDLALNYAEALNTSTLTISDHHQKPQKLSPPAPFTTSTLQQAAFNRLGFSVKQTMSVAQDLYRSGHISYVRTDSLSLSEEALDAAKTKIITTFGVNYHKRRLYHTKNKGAQEAHEAIRPTNFAVVEISGKDTHQRLYQLIYQRTLASQMTSAELEKTILTIQLSGHSDSLISEGSVVRFPGFLNIFNSQNDRLLPTVKVGETVRLKHLEIKENLSRPKPRYSEASLVKTIEKMGIGRPSTFSSMISTVQERQYLIKETREGVDKTLTLIEVREGAVTDKTIVEKIGGDKNKLFPSNTAYLLTDFLVGHFNDIVDYDFTARLENDFDKIAHATTDWKRVIKDFYQVFHQTIVEAEGVSRDDVQHARVLGVDPKSGNDVSVRMGRYGAYGQIGTREDDEKPLFASLRPKQSIETITLEEVLDLFTLPRLVGETAAGEAIKANYGRFGPYLQYGKNYVSLKEHTPEEVDLKTALELIEKREAELRERIIKTFTESPIQILKGRFGPYIWSGQKATKTNKGTFSVKKYFKDCEPEELTLKECKDVVDGKVKPIAGKRGTRKQKKAGL